MNTIAVVRDTHALHSHSSITPRGCAWICCHKYHENWPPSPFERPAQVAPSRSCTERDACLDCACNTAQRMEPAPPLQLTQQLKHRMHSLSGAKSNCWTTRGVFSAEACRCQTRLSRCDSTPFAFSRFELLTKRCSSVSCDLCRVRWAHAQVAEYRREAVVSSCTVGLKQPSPDQSLSSSNRDSVRSCLTARG